jgi:hypothetical protein
MLQQTRSSMLKQADTAYRAQQLAFIVNKQTLHTKQPSFPCYRPHQRPAGACIEIRHSPVAANSTSSVFQRRPAVALLVRANSMQGWLHRMLSTGPCVPALAACSTVNCQQKVHAAHQILYGNLEQFQVSWQPDCKRAQQEPKL